MNARFAGCLLLTCQLASAQETPLVIPLWPNGAPGFEERRNEPESAESYWVRNVNNPSITVFLPPKDKATGAAVVVCPVGGFRELVFNAEGVEPARYLNTLGVAAFALKYRLGREQGSPYSVEKHGRGPPVRPGRPRVQHGKPLQTGDDQGLATTPGGLDVGQQHP